MFPNKPSSKESPDSSKSKRQIESPFLDEELFSDSELAEAGHQGTRFKTIQLESPFLSTFKKTDSDNLDEFKIGETEEFEGYLDDNTVDEELEEDEEFLEDVLDEEAAEFLDEFEDEISDEEEVENEDVYEELEEDEEESDFENALDEETAEFLYEGENEEFDKYSDGLDENFSKESEKRSEFEEGESTEELYESDEAISEGEYSEDESDHESCFDEDEIDFEVEGDESDLDDTEDEYEEVDYNKEDHLTYDLESEEYQRGFYKSWDPEIEEETAQNVNSLIHNIVATAKGEFRKWRYREDGILKKLKETDEKARPHLEKYWKYGAKTGPVTTARRIRKRSAWSAAFISYVIYIAGGVPPFRRSGGHYVFAAKAKTNRAIKKYDKPISMWLYRIHEVKPQIGDILFNARVDPKDKSRNGANFDNVDNGNEWATHSDIVIDINGHYATVIGGNVRNSVNKNKRPIDSNGYVKLKGIKLKEYFGILRFFSPNDPPVGQAKKNNNTAMLSIFSKIGLGAYDFGRMSLRLFSAISSGQDENKLTNLVFYYKYPQKKGQKLKKRDPLAKEWIRIRTLFIRPLLRTLSGTPKTSFSGGDSSPQPLSSSQPKKVSTRDQSSSSHIPLKKHRRRGYSAYGGGRVEDVLKELKSQSKLFISNKDIEMLQRMANVESKGLIQGINSYDNAYMSFGFLQWPILYNNPHGGKLQRLVKTIPRAFAKYGIELDVSRKWKFKRGRSTYISIPFKGIRYARELRSRKWAERFYLAGIDPEIIVAEVALALRVIDENKKRIERRVGSYFLPHYQNSNVLRALIQESFNHRPRWLYRALRTATRKAKQRNGVDTRRFLELTRQAIRSVWAVKGKPRSGRNLVRKTGKLS